MSHDDLAGGPWVMCRVADLGLALGVQDLVHRPGLWVHRIDDRWVVAVNAHRVPLPCEPDGGMKLDVPPLSMAFWWNGWLAGIVDSRGGCIAAHPEGANEERLLEALDRAIAAIPAPKEETP